MNRSFLKRTITGLIAAAVFATGSLTILPGSMVSADTTALFTLSGTAHVQDIGNFSANQDESGLLKLGTEGQSRRLEEITINFTNNSGIEGSLEYRVHVQDIGWMDWVSAGNAAGTEGQAKRLEGVEIRLTGALAGVYTVEYSAHIENYGDAQGSVYDGALAGTTGEAKRVEEIRVKIVERTTYSAMGIKYRTHVQDLGWEGIWTTDGGVAGTTGQSRRLEAISIMLTGAQYSGGIKYNTHVQDYGWLPEDAKDGEMSGTQGQAKRLEAITIELTGDIANYYDIYYRVHSQDIGWMAWAKNGENAGTAGGCKRLEGIQIVLAAKGSGAPGDVSGIASVSSDAFREIVLGQTPQIDNSEVVPPETLPVPYQYSDFQSTYEKKGALTGLDVSAWQGDINWTAVKNAGVDFVIIRLARCSSTTQEMTFDTKFMQNYQGAKNAGLLVGAYYYCTRGDTNAVRADVNTICDYLEQNNVALDFPLAFDWEEYSKMSDWGIPDVNALNQLWYAYIDEMGKRGRDVMIYSSKWYLENWWDTCGKMAWVAHWTPMTNYSGEYHFWQISSRGSVDGIVGAVDLDIYYPMGHKAYAGS